MTEKQLPSQLPERQSAFQRMPRVASGRFPAKGTPEYEECWTPERREAQSQRARQQIREGTFGAANGFHRRKTRKFQEIAAEHAQQRAEEIIERLDAIIFSTNKHVSAQDRLRAIEMYGRFEDWSVKNSREDEKELRGMSNAQLDERLRELLADRLGIDLSGLEQVIDADAIDEGDVDDLVDAVPPEVLAGMIGEGAHGDED